MILTPLQTIRLQKATRRGHRKAVVAYEQKKARIAEAIFGRLSIDPDSEEWLNRVFALPEKKDTIQ